MSSASEIVVPGVLPWKVKDWDDREFGRRYSGWGEENASKYTIRPIIKLDRCPVQSQTEKHELESSRAVSHSTSWYRLWRYRFSVAPPLWRRMRTPRVKSISRPGQRCSNMPGRHKNRIGWLIVSICFKTSLVNANAMWSGRIDSERTSSRMTMGETPCIYRGLSSTRLGKEQISTLDKISSRRRTSSSGDKWEVSQSSCEIARWTASLRVE